MENSSPWHERLKKERERHAWIQEEVAANGSNGKTPSADKAELTSTRRDTRARKQWKMPHHSIRLAILAVLLISFSTVQWFFFTHRSNVSSQDLNHPGSPTASTSDNLPGATTTLPSTKNCWGANYGVSLYARPNYQGYCYTFAVNSHGQQYNLAQSDFAHKVGSLRDPDGAFHAALIDQFGRREYFESDSAQLSSRWQGQAYWLGIDKYPPTSCNPGSNGIVAYVGSNYQGGCLFITRGILDVGQFDFDHTFSSLRFVGSYINSKRLLMYRQVNYQNPCGEYWQDQSDLGVCGNLVASVQVLSLTFPTPT